MFKSGGNSMGDGRRLALGALLSDGYGPATLSGGIHKTAALRVIDAKREVFETGGARRPTGHPAGRSLGSLLSEGLWRPAVGPGFGSAGLSRSGMPASGSTKKDEH